LIGFHLPLIAMLAKELDMLQPGTFCEHTTQKNVTASKVVPQTLLLELTALPRPPD